MTKSNFKIAVMTSFLWRHRYYVTKTRHKTFDKIFPFWAPPNQTFWLRQW